MLGHVRTEINQDVEEQGSVGVHKQDRRFNFPRLRITKDVFRDTKETKEERRKGSEADGRTRWGRGGWKAEISGGTRGRRKTRRGGKESEEAGV